MRDLHRRGFAAKLAAAECALMPFRQRYLPERLLLNIRALLDGSGLSNGAIARALAGRGYLTEASTVSRWRNQVHAPADLRPLAEWSGVSERVISFGTEHQLAAAVAAAKTRGMMAPVPSAPPAPVAAAS